MTFQQLDPPLPVVILEKGSGMAFGVIDYGLEHHLFWVTAMDDGGEIWAAPNPQVRVQANWSAGRTKKMSPAKDSVTPFPFLPPNGDEVAR